MSIYLQVRVYILYIVPAPALHLTLIPSPLPACRHPLPPTHPPPLPDSSTTRAIIHQHNHNGALLDGGIGLDLQHAAVGGGAHGFQQVAPGVVDVDEVLVFGDVVEDVDERLGPAGLGGGDVDAVGANVGVAQVGHDGAVGADGRVGPQRPVRGRQRRHAQVGQQPQDEVLPPLDVFVAPRHGRPQLERDAWDRVFHPRRLDRAWLPRVDFDDVRLRQRGQPGVVWESVVGVGPHRPVGACGQLVW